MIMYYDDWIMRIGIIYYSRTGNTKKAAEILKNKLEKNKDNVDLIEVKHTKKPGFFKAGRAAMTQKELPIKNTDFDLKEYDTILVGSPTWAGKPAPFLRTFFNKAENIKGKKASVFITGSGSAENNSKNSKYLKDYLDSIGLKTKSTTLQLQMKKGDIKSDKKEVDEFVSKITKK